MPCRGAHAFSGAMDFPLLLVVVLVSLAILIRIDRGIKLLERLIDHLDSMVPASDPADEDSGEY